jgi:hypothetical protein
VIALLAIVAVAIIPIAIVVSVLALLVGVVASIAERDLGEGLFADPRPRSSRMGEAGKAGRPQGL